MQRAVIQSNILHLGEADCGYLTDLALMCFWHPTIHGVSG